MNLAKNIAGNWINHGAIVDVENGENPFEVLITWKRCPWPTFAKEYGVDMEEDVLCCDRILQTILKDIVQQEGIELFVIGDALVPRNLSSAVHDGYRIGIRI